MNKAQFDDYIDESMFFYVGIGSTTRTNLNLWPHHI